MDDLLPDELVTLIVQLLPTRDLSRVDRVSLRFHHTLVERALRARAGAAGWNLADFVPEHMQAVGRHPSC